MTPFLIYVITPILLLVLYLRTRRQMTAAQVERPPQLGLLLVFVFYCPLVLAVLTVLFWEWSGMASLGTMATMIVGSLVLSFQAIRLYSRRATSSFHSKIWWASAAFVPAVVLVEAVIALRYG